MKYTLVSFFNSTNMGDLLISKALKEKIEGYGQVETFDYSNGEQVNEINELYYNSASDTSNTSISSVFKDKVKSKLIDLKLDSVVLKTKSAISRKQLDNPRLENVLKMSDALIIGGGNMIFDLSPFSLSANQFEHFVNKATELNKPVFAISLGIGPFQNSYQIKKAVDSLAKCEYITFRDKKSYKLFKSYYPERKNISIAPDPVFHLPFLLDKKFEKNSIGINIINPDLFLNDMKNEKVINNYVSLINVLLNKREEDIILFNTEAKDYITCEQVYKSLAANERVKIVKIQNYEDLFKIYSQFKVVIGTRMHSLITAYSQNIPIIGLSWQQKVDAMFDLVEDSSSVYPLNDINNRLNEIVEKTEEKIINPNYLSFQEVTEKLTEMDETNNTYMQLLSTNLTKNQKKYS